MWVCLRWDGTGTADFAGAPLAWSRCAFLLCLGQAWACVEAPEKRDPGLDRGHHSHLLPARTQTGQGPPPVPPPLPLPASPSPLLVRAALSSGRRCVRPCSSPPPSPSLRCPVPAPLQPSRAWLVLASAGGGLGCTAWTLLRGSHECQFSAGGAPRVKPSPHHVYEMSVLFFFSSRSLASGMALSLRGRSILTL